MVSSSCFEWLPPLTGIQHLSPALFLPLLVHLYPHVLCIIPLLLHCPHSLSPNSQIRRHEHRLSEVALSDKEAAHAITECLTYLNPPPSPPSLAANPHNNTFNLRERCTRLHLYFFSVSANLPSYASLYIRRAVLSAFVVQLQSLYAAVGDHNIQR